MISSFFLFRRQATRAATNVGGAVLLRRDFATTRSGTVKFYVRNKGYGFIEPDGAGADVFVHRTGIISDLPPEVSSIYPYLKKGERVRFDTVADSGLDKAVQVTWVSGATIPPLRRNFLGSVHARARKELGDQCYEIMSDEEVNSDEDRLGKVKDAFSYAQSRIRDAEDLVVRLGMKIEDFPLVADKKNPGMFKFAPPPSAASSSSSSAGEAGVSDYSTTDSQGEGVVGESDHSMSPPSSGEDEVEDDDVTATDSQGGDVDEGGDDASSTDSKGEGISGDKMV